MANSLTLTTVDGLYTYTNTLSHTGVSHVVRYRVTDNFKKADTQGYLVKIQKGEVRVDADVVITDTETNIINSFEPLFTHNTDVTVTFPRNIPLLGSATGRFAIYNISFDGEELPGSLFQYSFRLTQVL